MNYEDYQKLKCLREAEQQRKNSLLNYNTEQFHRVIEDMTFKNIKSMSKILSN